MPLFFFPGTLQWRECTIACLSPFYARFPHRPQCSGLRFVSIAPPPNSFPFLFFLRFRSFLIASLLPQPGGVVPTRLVLYLLIVLASIVFSGPPPCLCYLPPLCDAPPSFELPLLSKIGHDIPFFHWRHPSTLLFPPPPPPVSFVFFMSPRQVLSLHANLLAFPAAEALLHGFFFQHCLFFSPLLIFLGDEAGLPWLCPKTQVGRCVCCLREEHLLFCAFDIASFE